MPGSVFSTNFAIAIKAPVLPADTTQAACPFATASMASRMLDWRPARKATAGLASPATASGVWRISATAFSAGR